MGRKRKTIGTESVTFKAPKIYGAVLDFLIDNNFKNKRSLFIRDAIKHKIKHVCKLIQSSDEFFEKKYNGLETFSFRLEENHLSEIEKLIRMGFYSSRSDFLREAVFDYIEHLKVLPNLLREKNELEKDKIFILDVPKLDKRIIVNGEKIKTEDLPKDE